MGERYERNKNGLPIRIREGMTPAQLERLGVDPAKVINHPVMPGEKGRVNSMSYKRRSEILKQMIRKSSQIDRKYEAHGDGWY